MNIFEDGPYEVGGETDHDESLVPVPANSYLGFSLTRGKVLFPKMRSLSCLVLLEPIIVERWFCLKET